MQFKQFSCATVWCVHPPRKPSSLAPNLLLFFFSEKEGVTNCFKLAAWTTIFSSQLFTYCNTNKQYTLHTWYILLTALVFNRKRSADIYSTSTCTPAKRRGREEAHCTSVALGSIFFCTTRTSLAGGDIFMLVPPGTGPLCCVSSSPKSRLAAYFPRGHAEEILFCARQRTTATFFLAPRTNFHYHCNSRCRRRRRHLHHLHRYHQNR